MRSEFQATSWLSARSLHQVQLLSCDYVRFERWVGHDLRAPFWRLFWHDRAGAVLDFEGRLVKVPARRCLLIPPNLSFSCSNRAPFGQVFLHFRVEPGLQAGVGDFQLLKADPALSALAGQLSDLLEAGSTSLELSLRAQALLSLALLEVPAGHWVQPCGDARITEAVATIRAAYPARVPVKSLARQAGLHPVAFIRLFRQTLGHTPGVCLANLRLEEACVLLQFSELSIDEVAAKTGYGERGYFSRAFAARLGVSPARYRRLVNTDRRLRAGGHRSGGSAGET